MLSSTYCCSELRSGGDVHAYSPNPNYQAQALHSTEPNLTGQQNWMLDLEEVGDRSANYRHVGERVWYRGEMGDAGKDASRDSDAPTAFQQLRCRLTWVTGHATTEACMTKCQDDSLVRVLETAAFRWNSGKLIHWGVVTGQGIGSFTFH